MWYRGHANAEWTLTPRILRPENEITVADEDELFNEFIRRGRSMAHLARNLDSYFLMQHHSIPTRLLDWTDSCLVALFFALKNRSTDAAVWALNPLWLNWNSVGQYSLMDPDIDPNAEAFLFDRIKQLLRQQPESSPPLLSMAVRPPWIGGRMFAQRSMFTLHGVSDIPIETYPLVDKGSPLCRIVVRRQDRSDVLCGLRACGITETAIFPDLDGLAKELVAEYGGF